MKHATLLSRKPRKQLALARRSILVLLFLLLPTQLAYHFWPDSALVYGVRVDYLSPTIYLTEVFMLLYLGSWGLQSVRPPKYFGHISIALIALVSLSHLSLISLVSLAKIFVLVLFVVRLREESDWVPAFIGALSAGTIFTSILSISQIVNEGTLGGVLYWFGERSFTVNTPGIALGWLQDIRFMRPYATFPHPNALAGYSVVAFFLIYLYHPKKPIHRVALVALVATVVVSWSQSAWIAIVLGVIVLRVRMLRSNIFLHGLVIITVMTSLALPLLAPALLQRELTLGIKERLELAVIAGHAMADFPLFGVGLGGFVRQVPQLWSQSSALTTPYIWSFQPVHNTVLLLVSEVGLIAFAFVTYLLMQAINVINSRLFAVLLSVVLMTGLVDHYWITLHQPRVLLAIVLALVLSKNSDTMHYNDGPRFSKTNS